MIKTKHRFVFSLKNHTYLIPFVIFVYSQKNFIFTHNYKTFLNNRFLN